MKVEGELFKIDSFVRYHKYCERYKKEKLIKVPPDKKTSWGKRETV